MLLTNSWLYHYYSVQSKIQFGLSYDTHQQHQHPNMSPRLAPPHSPSSFLHQQQAQPQALSHHHHLPYGSPHYSYGYPTTIHGSTGNGGGGLVGGNSASTGGQTTATHHHHHHNNNNNSHIIMNLNGFETVAKTQATTTNNHIVEDRPKTPMTATPTTTPAPTKRRAELSQNPQQTSSKKRAISRLEPIYIPDQSSSPPEDTMTELRNGFGGENSNQTVIMGTISYARPRTKFVGKLQTTPLLDSTEFIEQWNPSPPWSEAAQKVPDIGPQELSPYMTTTTPPTPNSANIVTPMAVSAAHLSSHLSSGPKSAATNGSLSGHGSAFSFDWVPEQFVPVATTDCSLALPPLAPPINCVSFLPQELSIHQSQHRSFSHWPTGGGASGPSMAHPHHPHHNLLSYEEVNHIHHLQQQEQQQQQPQLSVHPRGGVNMPFSGVDNLVSSGGQQADNKSNNGRSDSSDDDNRAGHQHPHHNHHPKGH